MPTSLFDEVTLPQRTSLLDEVTLPQRTSLLDEVSLPQDPADTRSGFVQGMDTLAEATIRAVPPVVGMIAAAPLTPIGQAAGFGLGMAAGDTAAQYYREARGLQDGIQLAPTVTAGLTGFAGGAIAPLVPIAAPTAPTTSAFLQSLVRPAAANAAVAATISSGAQFANNGMIDPSQTAIDTAMGASFGLLFNAAQARAATAEQRAYLINEARRRFGFQGETMDDLKTFVEPMLKRPEFKVNPSAPTPAPTRPPVLDLEVMSPGGAPSRAPGDPILPPGARPLALPPAAVPRDVLRLMPGPAPLALSAPAPEPTAPAPLPVAVDSVQAAPSGLNLPTQPSPAPSATVQNPPALPEAAGQPPAPLTATMPTTPVSRLAEEGGVPAAESPISGADQPIGRGSQVNVQLSAAPAADPTAPEQRSPATRGYIEPDPVNHGLYKTKTEATARLSALVNTIEQSPQMQAILQQYGLTPANAYAVGKTKTGQWSIAKTHQHEIAVALLQQKPVSATAVDKYGIKIPAGYVKQGELYVLETTPTATPQTVTPTPSAAAAADTTDARPHAKLTATALKAKIQSLEAGIAKPSQTATRRATLTTDLATYQAEASYRAAAKAAKGKSKGRGFAIPSLPDGSPDLINTLDELGGIRPRPRDYRGGEYDDLDLTKGVLRQLRRQTGRPIDKVLAELNEGYGYRFESPADLQAALDKALITRARLQQVAGRDQATALFQAAALENKGRGSTASTAKVIAPEQITEGDTFAIKREPVTVAAIDPDTAAITLKDGERFGTQIVPAGVPIYADKGSYQPAPAGEAGLSWGEVVKTNDARIQTEAEAGAQDWEAVVAANQAEAEAAVQDLPAPTRPSALMPRPKAQTLDMFDSGAAGMDFTMAGETAQDFTGNMDKVAKAAADKAAAEAAQGGLFDAPPPAPKSAPVFYSGDEVTWNDGTGRTAISTISKIRQPVSAQTETTADVEWFGAKQVPLSQLTLKKGGKTRESAAKRSGTSAASPGSASPDAYPGPDAFNAPTPPVDDPTFSAMPAELPEAVQFYRQLTGGQYPKIREKIRALTGKALGVFYHHPGKLDSGRIELRADIFRLVSEAERQRLLAAAVTWANLQRDLGATADYKDLISGRFEELVREAEQKALKENPRQALAVLWHEIGHFVDFLPDGILARGNLLGHIAALKKNLKPFIASHPGMSPEPTLPTANEQAKLRRQAEKELHAAVKETIETIRREEPIYRELPITPEHITSILKNAQRSDFPDLYDWFAKLDRTNKAAVLRAAMKGIVDERAARFGKREATGETRVVEETVTRRSGPEPTREDIQRRFEELLREEIKRRGLISERDLRAEANEVIKWWQGVAEVPQYFRTATETWAEVFSAMMNNPAGVAKRAPTLWRAFNAYLDARPEAAKIYRAMQDSIKAGAIHRERVLNLREMFHRDEDSSLQADSIYQKLNFTTLRDTVSVLFNRQTGPIQRRALATLSKDKNDRAAIGALSALKNYIYRTTGWEAIARDINLIVEKPLAAAGLHHDDMSEYIFHSRIAEGDRQQLANPLGWSPKTSAERLQAMQADLGPTRWPVLEQAAQDFRTIYEKHVISLIKQARILDPKLLEVIEARTEYATFAKARTFNPLEASTLQGMLENRYGKDVTARIYRQVGTLGEIRSPYLATIQKAFSLISTARRQLALKSIVAYLTEHEPASIIPAQERFAAGRWEPVHIESNQVGTLYTLNAGKIEAYYVPRAIYEMMNYGSPLESQIIGLAHNILAWPKAILTELNPGFWPVAFTKDIATMVVQLPKGQRALKQLPRAFVAARASMMSQPSALADSALKRLMVISRADNRGEHLGHADEITRTLLRMGQAPQLWDAEAKKIGAFLRFWMAWKRQGQVLERTVKFASMAHLDEAFPGMAEWEKKRIVNEQGGSPDFLEKGRAGPIVDFAMMFYTPWLRGLEAMKTSAQADPRGFWTKFLGSVGLAAAFYWMFEQGMTDAGLDKQEAENRRDMMRSIPERDKRRGFAIPLDWSDKEQGKVAYIVLPFPDSLRYLHTAQRAMLQSVGANGNAGEGFSDFMSYQGQDLPGMNPVLKEAGKWYDYHVLGQNPYDSFLGRGALPEDMVTAKSGGIELALQSASNLTGGIIYRHRPDRPGETPTSLEKFLQTPIVGNLLGRWVRVSNRGLSELTDRDVAKVRQREAELRLVGEEMIGRQMRGEAWSPAQEQLFAEEPYLAQRIVTRQMDLMQRATGPERRAWEQAGSTGERIALLDAWAKRADEREKRLAK
jgi:hypothetical protein